MNKSRKPVVFLSTVLAVMILVLIFLWTKYGHRAQVYECTNYAMGTFVQQTVYGSKRVEAATAAAKSVGELENLISWRVDGSDIDKLNQASGSDWSKLNAKTIALLQKCLDVAEKSEGAFDPTILPISSLWDFGGNNQHVPTSDEIRKYIKYVDYRNLRVDMEESSASLKNHYMAVDLGAAGKGAACDEAIAAYKAAGADAAIIAVGGSVGVYGTKPDQSSWHIAVRDPKDNESAAMGTIDLTSGFVSTSGSYEKCFTENGVTYHHLLNPKTGYPENNGLISTTVICENGALSDALSTACFILGKDKGMALLKEYNAEGIFIDSDNKVYITDNLKNSFKTAKNLYKLAE
jgi:thiamine biosynthesis lipoprotein